MLRKVAALVYRHYKKLLYILGVSSIAEIIKEVVRGKIMDWALSHLGPVGHWLLNNPVAFITLGIVGALLFLAVAVVKEAFFSRMVSSPALEHWESHFGTAQIPQRWAVGFVVSIIIMGGIVAYGVHKYRANTQQRSIALTSPTPGGQVASRATPLEQPQLATPPIKKRGIETTTPSTSESPKVAATKRAAVPQSHDPAKDQVPPAPQGSQAARATPAEQPPVPRATQIPTQTPDVLAKLSTAQLAHGWTMHKRPEGWSVYFIFNDDQLEEPEKRAIDRTMAPLSPTRVEATESLLKEVSQHFPPPKLVKTRVGIVKKQVIVDILSHYWGRHPGQIQWTYWIQSEGTAVQPKDEPGGRIAITDLSKPSQDTIKELDEFAKTMMNWRYVEAVRKISEPPN